MGQIVGGAAKPKRCNLNKLSQLGTPAAGEHILVSSDNSMNAAGQGNFDFYIEGNGRDAATALELKKINPEIDTLEDEISLLYKRYNAKNIRDNSWQNYITGAITEHSDYFIIEGIPVLGFENIKIARTVGSSDNSMGIVFYASDGTTKVGGYGLYGESINTIIVPDDAFYASITVKKIVYNSIKQLLFHPYTFYKTNDLRQIIDTLVVEGTDTDFMQLDDNYNLFLPSKASINYYVNGTNGQLVANNSFVASDFVPVAPNTMYYIQGGDVVFARYYAFYNANKEYISGENSTAGWLRTLQTPDNVQYVRFSGLVGTYNNIIFSKNPLSPSEYKYTPKSNVVITPADGTVTTPKIADGAVTEEKTIFFEHDPNSNFIDKNKLTSGYYINANGVPTSTGASNYFITDKVFLTEGETYYKGNLFGGYCAFYQEDGTLVQGYGASDTLPNPFVVPQGAVYGRFTLNVAGADQTCWIGNDIIAPVDYRLVIKRNLIPTEDKEITPKNYSGRDISTFAKIMCIGDSLTEGAFNYLVDGGFGNNTKASLLGRPYSYPQYLAKLTGCEVTNLGKSGYTSSQWYDYYTTGEGADTDFSGYDCAIIQLGVNDNAATLDTVTKTALDNIINKVKTANAGIKIFFAGIINAKSYPAAAEGESYYAKDQWLRNYYNYYYANDVQVFFIDHVAYGHLRDLPNAQHGGSYVVDNYNEGHLSAYGYWRLAQDYVSIISYIMSHNTAQDFRKIQFIGTSYQCY